jgi:hypothetical protein
MGNSQVPTLCRFSWKRADGQSENDFEVPIEDVVVAPDSVRAEALKAAGARRKASELEFLRGALAAGPVAASDIAPCRRRAWWGWRRVPPRIIGRAS